MASRLRTSSRSGPTGCAVGGQATEAMSRSGALASMRRAQTLGVEIGRVMAAVRRVSILAERKEER